MSESTHARILLVEDEEQVLKSLERFFLRQGFEVYGANNPQEALHLAQTRLRLSV